MRIPHHPLLPSLACALALTALGAPAAAKGGLADLVPEDVFLFASFAGFEHSSQAAEELGLYHLWREPEMQAVFAPLLEAYSAAGADAPAELLQHWDTVKGVFAGRMSLAVGGINLLWTDDGPVPTPGAVLALETPGGSDSVRELFTGLRHQFSRELAREGVSLRDEELAGHAVTAISIRDNDVTLPLYVAFLDDQVLLGFNRFLIGKCLANHDGGAQGTLAKSGAYRRSKSKAAANSLVEVFFNVSAFTSRVRGLMPEEVLTGLNDLGLDSVNAVYMASGIENGAGSDVLYVDAPAPRSGLLGLSGKQGLSAESLARVPAGAAWFTAGRCDLGAAWDIVLGAVENFAPPQNVQQIHGGLAMAESVLGFSVREELLESLGDEFVMYAEMPQNGLIPNVVLSIAMEDGEEFEMILDRMLMMGEVELRPIEFEGHVLNMFQIPDAPFAPAYTIQEDRLLAGLTLAGLKGALRHDGATSVQDQPDFRTTFAGLPVKRAESIEYIDIKRLAAFGYNVLENMGPGAVPPEVPLDLAHLPSQETVLGHLTSWGTISVADKDGIVVRSRALGAAVLLSLGSRFLMEAEGCPPFALENLENTLNGHHDRQHFDRRQVQATPSDSRYDLASDAAPAPTPSGLINPLAKDDPRRAELEQRLTKLGLALQADPSNSGVYFQRGLVNSQLGNLEKALGDYHRASELGANPGSCNYNMACCLSLLGRVDEALEVLELSLEKGFSDFDLLAVDTDLDPLRGEPRFTALVARFAGGA